MHGKGYGTLRGAVQSLFPCSLNLKGIVFIYLCIIYSSFYVVLSFLLGCSADEIDYWLSCRT